MDNKNKTINERYQAIVNGRDEAKYLAVPIQSSESRINNNMDTSVSTIYLLTKIVENGGFFQTTRKEIELATGSSKTSVNDSIQKMCNKGFICKYEHYKLGVTKKRSMTKGKFTYKQAEYMLVATPLLADYLQSKNIPFEFIDLDVLHEKGKEHMYKETIVREFNEKLGIWVVKIYKTDFNGNRTLETTYNQSEIKNSIQEHVEIIEELNNLEDNVVELEPTKPLMDPYCEFKVKVEALKTEEEQITLFHEFIISQGGLDNNRLKELDLTRFIHAYNRLCNLSYERVNIRAEKCPWRLTEEPDFKD